MKEKKHDYLASIGCALLELATTRTGQFMLGATVSVLVYMVLSYIP